MLEFLVDAIGIFLRALADFRKLAFNFFEFVVGELFQIDEVIASTVKCADEFIKLQVHGFGVAVLGVLDQEHHQKCDDRRAGINDQLPRVGVME